MGMWENLRNRTKQTQKWPKYHFFWHFWVCFVRFRIFRSIPIEIREKCRVRKSFSSFRSPDGWVAPPKILLSPPLEAHRNPSLFPLPSFFSIFLVNSWTQIIQWSSVGHITIHFRGLNGLRRAPKPKFWLFDQKIQNGCFRPFSFSKVQKPHQWS